MAKKKEEQKNEGVNFEFRSFERGVVKTPIFSELWNKPGEWLYNGVDNLYPQELLRLFLDASSLHTAIIRAKSSMIAGNGFIKEGLSPAAQNFLKNPFGDESLDKVAFKAGMDLSIYGGFYLNVCWSKDGTKIARIEHVPAEKVRIGKPEEESVTEYYVSRDWQFYRRGEKNEPKKVPSFNILDKENPSQILFAKQYSPGSEYYQIPSYTAVLNWIKLASEINIFHLKSVQNNMNLGIIIKNPSGTPPQEMRDIEYQKIKARLTGSDTAGDVLLLYAENKDKMPEIEAFPNNGSDQRFRDLIELCNTNIILGHGCNDIVAGQSTPGKLSQAAEVEQAYNAFQQKEINPMQKIVEDCFNRLATINGIGDELKLEKFKPFDLQSGMQTADTNTFTVKYIR